MQCVVDLKRSRCFIKILPLQAAKLSPAQASGQFGVEEVVSE